MIGVRADGTKELVALADGFCESTESWAGVLAVVSPARDDRTGARGRRRGTGGSGRPCGRYSPTPASSGAGFGRQLQRPCRPAEVGAPRREGRARRDLQRRGQGPRPAGAGQSIRADARPRQVARGIPACITEHVDVLLAFYDYPAEHWGNILRTTNPIESTFATVLTSAANHQGPGLEEQPASQWRSSSSSPHKPAGGAVNAPHLVAALAGARFE